MGNFKLYKGNSRGLGHEPHSCIICDRAIVTIVACQRGTADSAGFHSALSLSPLRYLLPQLGAAFTSGNYCPALESSPQIGQLLTAPPLLA